MGAYAIPTRTESVSRAVRCGAVRCDAVRCVCTGPREEEKRNSLLQVTSHAVAGPAF